MEYVLEDDVTRAANEPQCPPDTRASCPFQDVHPLVPDSNPLFATRFVPTIVPSVVPLHTAVSEDSDSSSGEGLALVHDAMTASSAVGTKVSCPLERMGLLLVHLLAQSTCRKRRLARERST